MPTVYPEAQSKLRDLNVDPLEGLDSRRVEEMRRKYGSNTITLPDPDPWWQNLFEKFTDNPIPILVAAADISISLPLIQSDFAIIGWILLATAVLAVAGYYVLMGAVGRSSRNEEQKAELEERVLNIQVIILILVAAASIVTAVAAGVSFIEGAAILVAVALATGVGYINEYRSQQEYERLKLDRLDIPVTVTRNGREEVIQIADVVVGDIVHFETGRKIPADCVLLHSESMYADQSAMTGESVPVLKNQDDAVLFGGTDVVAGSGSALVLEVGNNSKWGEIARVLVSDIQEKTPLEERLDDLTEWINKAGTIAAVLIFVALAGEFVLTNWVFNPGTANTDVLVIVDQIILFFIIAVTIVVVAVPEGLPMAVNVSLALSMKQIAKDNNLVRKLVATETIGSSTVILSDKTGTLTKNQMTVSELHFAGERITGGEIADLQGHKFYDLLLLSTIVNSTAHLIEKEGQIVPDGNSTEGALLVWSADGHSDYRQLRRDIELIKRVPFNAETKRMSSVVQFNGQKILLMKGAPERVIPLCSYVETKTGTEPIAPHQDDLEQELLHQTNKAMRPLALAYKTLPDGDLGDHILDNDLVFLALIGIADPMRQDVPEAIAVAHAAGIDVKMVTGDNMKTATVLAQELGMLDSDSIVMEGEEFRKHLKMQEVRSGVYDVSQADPELLNMLPRLRVLARAEPMDKYGLVELLKRQRQVVAVTGDGANDAPALKSADVGISMGLSGTEVAKEASDIVLLDDNFGSIVKAVHWGRTLYENIQKFLQFQLTINFSALAIAFLSPLLNMFLEPIFGVKLLDIPLTVVQLLWINLIMDTLAVLALCLEPPSPDTMERKPVGRKEPIVTRTMVNNILGLGGYFTILLLILMGTDFFGLLNSASVREYVANTPGVTKELLLSTMIFTTYVFFQVFNLFNARSLHITKSPFARLSKSRNFLVVLGLIVIVQVLLTVFGGQVFRTVTLPLNLWLVVLAIAATALLFGEVARHFRLSRLQRHEQAGSPSPVS